MGEIPTDGTGTFHRVDIHRGDGDTGLEIVWALCTTDERGFLSVMASLSSQHDAGFPVSSFSFLRGDRLLIAGVDPDARWPIYQVWTLTPPRFTQEPKPAAGSRDHVIAEPEIHQEERIRAAGTDSTYGCAQCVMPAEGADGQLYVWILTYPQCDLRRLDLSSGGSTLMLSPTHEVEGREPHPGLVREWESGFAWGQHKVHGNMFVLSSHRGDVGPAHGADVRIVLADQDLDGWLDDAEPHIAGLPGFSGLEAPENWVR